VVIVSPVFDVLILWDDGLRKGNVKAFCQQQLANAFILCRFTCPVKLQTAECVQVALPKCPPYIGKYC
jgi:hypothetical protein